MIQLVLLSRVAFREREITGPRIRGLIALLADDLRSGCGTARLVDGLWPDEQPENPTKALQVVVSRARARLGGEIIASTPTGYRLALDEDQVDAAAVVIKAAQAARDARAGDHDASLAHAEAGLALFAGAEPGLAGDDPLAVLRADRADTLFSLRRAKALALSRLGRHAEALDALGGLVRERPRDEELLLELVGSEAATAGPSSALATYDTYRRSLRDELGTDPGPALRALHQQLLAGEAPAVRRVPHEPNPLLGRDDDLAAVRTLLRTNRVASIVGPGGLGKTRLAQAVSCEAEQRVVHFVPLAGVATDENVVPDVASAIGDGELKHALAGPVDALGSIVNAIGAGPALLVLDNCEHVIDGVAGLARDLVAMTKDLRILTTSRTPLRIAAEAVYQLPELPLAFAVELFEQRARAARAGVELPADTVTELCRHLDGLPLAVELAAARVRVMSVMEIADRLGDRFALLRGNARDAPERHRTLHAVVDWSWNLLDEASRAAMRTLSVFPGGFTAAAAEHLLGADAMDVVADLVDQSLVRVADTDAGGRYSMLDTVREYGAARRDEAGEADRAVAGFLAWATDFGLANHELVFGPQPYRVAARIRAERDNLLLALRYGLERGDAATVAATAAVLASVWTFEGNYARVTTLTEQTSWLLSHVVPGPELVEAVRAASTLCVVNTFMIQGPRAMRALITMCRLPPAPPDNLARAMAAVLVAVYGAADGGRSKLNLLCDSEERLVAGLANGITSYLLEADRDPDGALAAAERMLAVLDDPEMPWLPMMARSRLGELCLQAERGEEAIEHITVALRQLKELGPGPDSIGLRWGLVLAYLQLGSVEDAEQVLELAVADSVGVEDSWDIGITFHMGVHAEIQLLRGEVDAGLRLWRRAVEVLRGKERPGYPILASGADSWLLEVTAVTVVAHARHHRLDLVADITAELPATVLEMLETPMVNAPPSFLEFPVCGALLLALGLVDIDRGESTGGVELIAVAERFRFIRNFQQTMSSRQARQAAENADKPAYDDALSSYAGLAAGELRAAALALLRARVS